MKAVKALSCSICGGRSIYFKRYSGEALCEKCFKKDVVNRVRRTISRYDLLKPYDRIMVAVSGGKDSLALLKILYEIEQDFPQAKLFAALINEGIGEDYREESEKIAEQICSDLGVPFYTLSFEEAFGFTLREAVESGAAKKLGVNPCTICGVLRRKALVLAARRLNATVIATAHTLDDVVQTYLLNLLKGEGNIKPVGLRRENGYVIPRVAPLRLVPEHEIALYAYLEKIPFQTKTCPYTHTSMRDRVRTFLNWYAAHRPEALYAFLNNFERMLPKPGTENRCEICGEPTSRRICRACELELAIRNYLRRS